jgi:hypothetical protein
MKTLYPFSLCCCFALAIVAPATAGTLSIPMVVEFSGATPPAGMGPWVHVYLDDSEQNGTLTLWMDNLGLMDNEFVTEIYLNLDAQYDVTKLRFDSPTQTGQFDLPTISLGQDQFKADGDGFFDILMEFSNAGPKRFGRTEILSYVVSLEGSPLPLLAFLQIDLHARKPDRHL